MRRIPEAIYQSADEIDARISERESDALWLDPSSGLTARSWRRLRSCASTPTRSAGWPHLSWGVHIKPDRMPTELPQSRRTPFEPLAHCRHRDWLHDGHRLDDVDCSWASEFDWVRNHRNRAIRPE